MGLDARRTEGEPHDRLTRYADEMTAVLDDKGDEASDVRAIVMLNDPDRGGIVLHGYEDDTTAMVDLFVHLKAVFEANGKMLMFAPIGDDG